MVILANNSHLLLLLVPAKCPGILICLDNGDRGISSCLLSLNFFNCD